MAVSNSKFKNDSGIYYTKAIFYELTNADKSTVVYTLKNEDHEGYPSLRRLYLECNDPSGYVCAVTCLGGMDHWRKLIECEWFKPHLAAWEEELELKLRSEALLRLMKEASNPESKAYIEMNKLLLNKGWLSPEQRAALVVEAQTKGSKTRGRVSNQKIKEEALRLFESGNSIESDYERLTRN